MIPKRSKVVDMRFHWLKCREARQQFNIKWKQETLNKADYPSKHHPPAVHQQRHSQYIVNAAVTPENKNLAQQIKNVARWCAKPLPGLTQTKSQVRENKTGQTTARQRGSDATGETQGMHTQAHGTYVSVTEPALEGRKTNARNK
eukprot:15364622-Ditylum_brightwellii.AAC.2